MALNLSGPLLDVVVLKACCEASSVFPWLLIYFLSLVVLRGIYVLMIPQFIIPVSDLYLLIYLTHLLSYHMAF